MSSKRALVVDDSKSARAFLSRLLEKHHLDVDTAESAEDAIDYLTRHRPDVIFMDHLMPGMDGFQAVQSIKNNPRTATIPILMYTSQEGELYLGQARALGAIGVLPKQIHPADVSQVLQQLKLVEAPQDAAPESPGDTAVHRVVPTDAAAETTAEVAELAEPPPPSADGMAPRDSALHAELAQLRELFVAGLDRHADRLREGLRADLRAALQEQPAPVMEVPPGVRDWRGTIYATFATLVAVGLAALWLHAEVDRRALAQQLAQLSAERASAVPDATVQTPAEAPPAAAGRAMPSSPATGALVVSVPYGEPPFAGSRVDRLHALLTQLAQGNFQGIVELQAYPGRFCLAGNATDGYSVAPEATSLAQCELIGNPVNDNPGAAQGESLQFANMVAEFRKQHGEAIELRLGSGSADQVAKPYPESAAIAGRSPTAGEWNAAAVVNNRVEIRWRPRN